VGGERWPGHRSEPCGVDTTLTDVGEIDRGAPQDCTTVQSAAVARTEDLRSAAQPPQVVPGELSTPELCLAWRRSYFALLDVPAGPGRCEIVRIRERLLDEIERRDRDGFTRWLATGARAGSDPGRYLTTNR
jgi:hypothetical protein